MLKTIKEFILYKVFSNILIFFCSIYIYISLNMSIFDLKTQTSELQLGNSGVSKSAYEMIAPSRDVSDTSFSNGPISFKFQHSSTKWWMPSKSYLRTRMSITKGDGTQLANVDNIAPAVEKILNCY